MTKSEQDLEVVIRLSPQELVELNWHLDPNSQNLFYFAEPRYYNSLLEKADKAYSDMIGGQSNDEE